MSFYIDIEKTADGELKIFDLPPTIIEMIPVGMIRVSGHTWGNGGSLSVQHTTNEGRVLVASIAYPIGDAKPPF